jgi:hypothetical protein
MFRNKQFYYQSEVFSNILLYVQNKPNKCKLKQSNQNLILMVFEVNSIKQGMHYLNEIAALSALPAHDDRT